MYILPFSLRIMGPIGGNDVRWHDEGGGNSIYQRLRQIRRYGNREGLGRYPGGFGVLWE